MLLLDDVQYFQVLRGYVQWFDHGDGMYQQVSHAYQSIDQMLRLVTSVGMILCFIFLCVNEKSH